MIRTALSAALFAAAIAAAPASAFAPPSSQPVSYAGLDLSRPADAARLRRRIAAALENVCGSYATSESWEEREIARCRAGARAAADAQLAGLTGRAVQVAAAGR
ncbi:MAG TPA: UrcA family protein [Allosphingosinicella sp.]|nr:UrcA family protein [Allosphingosinicella sp.]